VSFLKGKNAAAGMYVVVHHVPGAEPETHVGKPWDLEAANRIRAGVIDTAPEGFFAPDSGNTIRVVSLAEWNQSLVAAALLES